MKSIDVSGVCNGLVDIFADVTEEQFSPLGFERGTMRLVELDEQAKLLKELTRGKPVMVSGGSVANSLIAIAQLGGKSAMYTRLADDEYGRSWRPIPALPKLVGACWPRSHPPTPPDAPRLLERQAS